MAIERITEAQQVVIGKHYLVPCVQARTDWGTGYEWTAVIGPKHEDQAIIGFPHEHWHHDIRFTSSSMLYHFSKNHLGSPLISVVMVGMQHDQRVQWMRKQCRREMPDFPVAPFLHDLERAYAGARLKPDCRTCPHRGLPLGNLPVRNGVVVCNGHGLAFVVKTGALHRRAS